MNIVSIIEVIAAYSNALKIIRFNNQKHMNIERRAGEDRRQVNLAMSANRFERRKIPDRRIEGLDVRDLTLSEEDFFDMFDRYISQR